MTTLTRVLFVVVLSFSFASTMQCADELTAEAWAGGSGVSARDGTASAARFYVPVSVAVDSAGNVYVAEAVNHTIRKITSAGVVTTLAGSAGLDGSTDGTGAAARFYSPFGVAVDSAGNVYVADTSNHTIRKITSAGVVTTLAGTVGSQGSNDGTGVGTRFDNPSGVAVDGAGNVYVADSNNHTIRAITSAGVVTTLAGTAGTPGSADGTRAAASFYTPSDVAVDSAGNVYVADTNNHTIRKITSAGVVTTLAGTAGAQGSADGTGAAARFNLPYGVAVDSAGNVYVADTSNHTIRKVTSAGVVTTLAGTAGSLGSTDGTGAGARFGYPRGVAMDSAGNVYVADGNCTIRKVTSVGVVTTLAGTAGTPGSADGTRAAARFAYPRGVAVDSVGNLYVADTSNHTIRKITSAGVVTTLAGTAGSIGSTDGTGTVARFSYPFGVAVDSTGHVYVADTNNHTIRKVTSAGVVTTLAGTAGSPGSTDGTGGAARFSLPFGVAVDSAGNVYVADTFNHTIRKVTSAGVVTTLAGNAGSQGSTDGTGAGASFFSPQGLAVDSAGNVYVADTNNHTIRKITSAGVVTTLAGIATFQGSADGTGAAARFAYPRGVSVDSAGSVYVADTSNHTIRKVTSAGVVTTLAGTAGLPGGTDGTGAAARFSSPSGVAVDSAGYVFVADSNNHGIRKCAPALDDTAAIDQTVCMPGQLRQLQASHGTATTWRWEWIRHPAGSTATLSSTVDRNPTFTPDIADVYTWRLYASAPGLLRISEVTLTVNAGQPVVTVRTSLPYGGGGLSVLLDPAATIQDADSANFDTGNLSIINTGLPEDELSIQSAGTIRVIGTTVEYDASAAFAGGELPIGSIISDGRFGADLLVVFSANCTPSIAQELLRHVAYRDTLPFPNTVTRSLRVSVTDDAGLTSASAFILLFPPASPAGGGGDSGDSGCSTGTNSTSLWLLLLGLLALPLVVQRRQTTR